MGSIRDKKRSIDSMPVHNQTSEAALATLGRKVLEAVGIYLRLEIDAADRSACCSKYNIIKRSLKVEERDFLTRNMFSSNELLLPALNCTRDEAGNPQWHQDPRNRTGRFTVNAPAASYYCCICSTFYSEEQVRLLPDEPDEGWDDDHYYDEDSEAEEYEESEESEAEEDEPEVLDPLEEQEEDVIE